MCYAYAANDINITFNVLWRTHGGFWYQSLLLSLNGSSVISLLVQLVEQLTVLILSSFSSDLFFSHNILSTVMSSSSFRILIAETNMF